MLQTDLHNKANSKRMTKEEFVRNNRGIDAGDDLPYIFLSDIYDRIRSSVSGCDGDACTQRGAVYKLAKKRFTVCLSLPSVNK